MSKSKKLRERLGALPKDFTWEELVTLLGQYGFNILNGSGSKRKFVNDHGRLVSFHCPHPGNVVKGYVLKEVKTLLDELDNHE
ncbi:type II toxin-antitoxin system HicA family toxin [Kosakonia quasisacchari]|uniref:Type II toxin-antitoxin system HicA family toxin n=1 Tax=Kosakonia quasisacchari TaxID=2529380 RepID=A0A4R0GML0_9ENTR|nr:type II toxin-antitoxin system HicA family toxin [Kosakonia quasisacchari]TCB98137.1 type II toxin-antitoxin system HicA family toxin [Kosakonia quasisacchari]